MYLKRFNSYILKDGSIVTMLEVSRPEAYVTWRVKHPTSLLIRTGLTFNFIDMVESEVTEPDFDYVNLTLLEALEACRTVGRCEDLRYVYNTADRTWYHLSSAGQFHKYLKVPGEDAYYWVTTDITIEHIKSMDWCVPNKVFGYEALDSADHIYNKIC